MFAAGLLLVGSPQEALGPLIVLQLKAPVLQQIDELLACVMDLQHTCDSETLKGSFTKSYLAACAYICSAAIDPVHACYSS